MEKLFKFFLLLLLISFITIFLVVLVSIWTDQHNVILLKIIYTAVAGVGFSVLGLTFTNDNY